MTTQSKGSTELERYEALTPNSRAMWEEARRYMPGGDTRNSIFWAPYPVYINHGEGCHTLDVDGIDRLDFIGNMTSLPLGNAYPPVIQAVQEQAAHGLVYNAPNEHQIRLAKLLCERVPSVEMVRFTNSGTEATLNTIRAARALTGRTKIAKCEGAYHGTHDVVSVSVRNDPALAGDADRPRPVPSVGGLPQEMLEQVVIIPFNDMGPAREILEEQGGDLAAVIVEPVLGSAGMVPAEPEFLSMLRDVTERHGVVLIFDEVISFRVGPGGTQGRYGITPDMTAFGKIIGGGFPVGAFGGRRDLMDLYDPTMGPKVGHAGTFNGNPMTMLAGAITLEQMTPVVYGHLDAMADRLKEGVRDVCCELEVPARVTGLGSLLGIHFVDRPIRTWRDIASGNMKLRQQVFWGLMNEGIFFTPQLVGCVSNPMGEQEVDTFIRAFRRVLERNVG